MERQLAKGGTANLSGVAEHPGEIDSAGTGRGYWRAVDSAWNLGKVAVAGDPAIAFVIKELWCFHGSPLEDVEAEKERGA
jgi:hypothetical protein